MAPVEFLCDDGFNVKMCFVGRMERIERDFAVVARVYADDIRALGYRFEDTHASA